MKIIYLTSHIQEADFDSRYASVEKMPNPAGQNFHGKVLRSLALVEETDAYCLVPQPLGKFTRDDFESEGIHYHYVYGPKNPYTRALLFPRSLAKDIAKHYEKEKHVLILFDSLSATLSLASQYLSKTLGAPRIALLTDEAANLTGASPSYVKRIHSLTESANGCIALTEGLAQNYGFTDKPSYIQPIYAEKEIVEPVHRVKPYFYYGGALFVKDGTKDLIDVYRALKPDYDLVLSGHGPYAEEAKKAAEEDPGIVFLGQIAKKEHYAYIAGSSLAINPRRYNPSLDALAVPSKVMEYLTYADCVASTLSTPIEREFGEAVNWIYGDLLAFFKAHLKDGQLVGLRPNDAKDTIMERFGLQKSAFLLQRFLRRFE